MQQSFALFIVLLDEKYYSKQHGSNKKCRKVEKPLFFYNKKWTLSPAAAHGTLVFLYENETSSGIYFHSKDHGTLMRGDNF